jgi:hypothetical protein
MMPTNPKCAARSAPSERPAATLAFRAIRTVTSAGDVPATARLNHVLCGLLRILDVTESGMKIESPPRRTQVATREARPISAESTAPIGERRSRIPHPIVLCAILCAAPSWIPVSGQNKVPMPPTNLRIEITPNVQLVDKIFARERTRALRLTAIFRN